VEEPNEKAAEAAAVAEFDLRDEQRKRLVVQRVIRARTKGMCKILPTGVAALLMATSAHATENPDMCAVVLKSPDGFLALRTKPEPKSKMMSKLFPGQVLRVDIDKYRSKNWIYVEGLVENSERLDGCPILCLSNLRRSRHRRAEKPTTISSDATERSGRAWDRRQHQERLPGSRRRCCREAGAQRQLFANALMAGLARRSWRGEGTSGAA